MGSPTEVAILRASIEAAAGPNKMQSIKSGKPEFWSIPFNSQNKWMLTVHANHHQSEKKWTVVLAQERMLGFCQEHNSNPAKANIEREMKRLMDLGHRVLCLAARELAASEAPKEGKFEGSTAADVDFPVKDFSFISPAPR